MPKQTKTLLGIPVNGKSQEEINTIIDNLGLKRLSEKSLQMLRSFPEDEREFYVNHSNAIQQRPYKEKEREMEHCVLNTSLLPAEDDEKDDYPELGL